MATLAMTKAEQKEMRANKSCPCCGAALTQKQTDHIMSGQDDGVQESFRTGEAAEMLRLVEGAEERGGMTQEEKNYLHGRLQVHESQSLARDYCDAWRALLGSDARPEAVAAAIAGPRR